LENLNNIIRFYRDCYQFDTKGIKINSFFSKECSHLFIPENFEILQGKYDAYPIDTAWAKEVEKTLLLESKEKALYGGSVFVKAKTKQLGKTVKVIAPLYIHELSLEQRDDVYFIKIVDSFINPKFVESLNAIDSSLAIKVDTFFEAIPINPIGFDHVIALRDALIELLPGWELSSVENLYNLEHDNQQSVKALKSRTIVPKKIYAAFLLGIFNKPVGSRGVITELTDIAEKKISSKLLQVYFGNKEIPYVETRERPIHVPVDLSAIQKKVFYTMDSYDLSMVIGPPGTGKSFTIAALVIDLINRGNSVLIASKNSQAGKVVAKKVEEDFGITKILIKTERQSYRRSLIAKLTRIAYGINYKLDKVDLERREKQLINLQKEIDDLYEQLLINEEKEIAWGEFYFKNKQTFFTGLRKKWIEYQKRKLLPVWKVNDRIATKSAKKVRLLKKFIRDRYEYNLEAVMKKKRAQIVTLIEALKTDRGNALEEKFDQIDFDLILDALPAWVCNSQEISKILPLQEEMFDVAIVDEASQCDLATMIPILYRAKKLIVVGDPKQLRHYSFLSNFQQNEFIKRNGIQAALPNYRKESLIDLTQKVIGSQNQINFLNEHYRSKPDIIRFSNQHFYSGQLDMMRATPQSSIDKNVEIVEVEGVRNTKGVNEEEARHLIRMLVAIMEKEEHIPISASSTIGIISPFTAQTKYIKSQIRKSIDNRLLKKHKVLVGTPYQFQGEERGIVLLSFAIDNNTHPSAFMYLNREDVFNVSISRARDFQIIFTSIAYRTLDDRHLLSQYLNEEYAHLQEETKPENFHDLFINEVREELMQYGIHQIYSSIIVSGVEIDLAVVRQGKTFCIDLIGYPGDFAKQFSPHHMRMLNRMKQSVFYIPYSSWNLEREKTVKNLLRFLVV